MGTKTEGRVEALEHKFKPYSENHCYVTCFYKHANWRLIGGWGKGFCWFWGLAVFNSEKF